MSSLAEIERAISHLPPEQWTEVRRWMDAHTPQVAEDAGMAEFDAWLASPSFAHGHRGVQSGGGHPGAEGGAPAGERPLSMSAELWSYEIATAATPQS